MTVRTPHLIPLALALAATTASAAQDSAQEADPPTARTLETDLQPASPLNQTALDPAVLNRAALSTERATATPEEPRVMPINWDNALADMRRQTVISQQELSSAQSLAQLPRPDNAQLVDVTGTRLPVLVPNMATLGIDETPRIALFPHENFYTLSITGSNFLIEVFGTRMAHAEVPDARVARQLGQRDNKGYRIVRTEYGQELTFNRYGAAYSITIECDDPRFDPRCTSDSYARQVANGLLVAAGTPAGQGER